MTYQESAEPLTFKQKAKRKAKRAGIITSYLFVFILGGVAIPKVMEGYDLIIAPFFEEKPYIAPVDATEKAILDDMKDPVSMEQCRDFSVQRVKLRQSHDYTTKANDAYSAAMQAEARISKRSEPVSTLFNTANLTAGMDIRSASNTFETGKSSTK